MSEDKFDPKDLRRLAQVMAANFDAIVRFASSNPPQFHHVTDEYDALNRLTRRTIHSTSGPVLRVDMDGTMTKLAEDGTESPFDPTEDLIQAVFKKESLDENQRADLVTSWVRQWVTYGKAQVFTASLQVEFAVVPGATNAPAGFVTVLDA